jgi:hypothetical protein
MDLGKKPSESAWTRIDLRRTTCSSVSDFTDAILRFIEERSPVGIPAKDVLQIVAHHAANEQALQRR